MDYDSAPTVDEIEKAVAFIKTFREKQQSVYVHCKAGRGRSAFLVVCYLVKVICVVLFDGDLDGSKCMFSKVFSMSEAIALASVVKVKPTVREFV